MSKREQLRVVLVGAGFNTDNLGVGALTVGAIKCILSQFPRADISLLDYGTVDASHSVRMCGEMVRIPVVNMRFSWRIYLGNNIALLLFIAVLLKLIPSRLVRDWLIRKNECFHRIYEADLVTSIAGGDSFSDIYGLERLLYMSLPQILVLLLNKKLVLLPQTIGPFQRKFSRGVARYIVRRAEHVYSRERAGLKELEVLLRPGLAKGKASFCYDVAFAVDPHRPEGLEAENSSAGVGETSTRVGMNISGLLFMGGYTRNNMFGLRADYREFIYRAIDLLILKKGANVTLIPHVFGTGKESESDLTACEEVYEQLKAKYNGQLRLVRSNYDPSEMKYVIGQFDFFVGSRMHSCIAAVSQCIPATSIAYSDKFVGVMRTLGIESSVADARTLTENELLDVMERNYDGRSGTRRHLEQKMKEVEWAVANLFIGLFDLPSNMACREPACTYPPAA